MDETKLLALQGELKTYFDKAALEQKANGTMLEETKTAIAKIQTQVDAIDLKLAAKHSANVDGPTLETQFKENDSLARLLKDRTGKAVIQLKGQHVADLMERKTTITSAAVGAETTGILQIERDRGIVLDARPVLRVRDALSSRPTTFALIDYVKINAPMANGSPQTEAGLKFENAVTFTTVSIAVKTLATIIPATRQILDDFTELLSFLKAELPYRVNKLEDLQLLSGDNTGSNLNGLVTQATAFDTSLLSAPLGWNKMDILGRVIQQITAADEHAPSFVILHPTDWWGIRLTKDSQGRYLFGDPVSSAPGPIRLFGMVDAIPTTQITAGTFLVGSGDAAAAEVRDRMEMQVEISTEHSDYFARNMVAIRAEKRLCLVVKRPASFIKGTFTTSP